MKVEGEPLPAPKPRAPPGPQSTPVEAGRPSPISSVTRVSPVDTKTAAVGASGIASTTTPTVTPATIRANGAAAVFEEKLDTVCSGARTGSGFSKDGRAHVGSRTAVEELPGDTRNETGVVTPRWPPPSVKAKENSIASSSLARTAADDRNPIAAVVATAVNAGASVEQKTPAMPTDSDASATMISPLPSPPRPPEGPDTPGVGAIAGLAAAAATESTSGTRAPSAVNNGGVSPAESVSHEVTKNGKSFPDADAPGAEIGIMSGAQEENGLLSAAAAQEKKQTDIISSTKKQTLSAKISSSTRSASTAATSPAAATKQVPTTGYQLEHMWRSAATSSDPDARLKLLRAVPPSSIVKIFRYTPLEVELLEGILGHLGAAFLPGRPATAMRWLKSLSKASRFGMAVSLMGEKGQGPARELIAQIEASSKREELEALRKQYLC